MAAKKRKKFIKERPPAPDPVNDQWRLFLAVQLPEDIRELIRAINHELSGASLPLRLVEPKLAHITLHFLGETDPERAELLKLALSGSLRAIRPFHLSTTTPGAFPNERRPRILWLGLDGDTGELSKVHAALARTLKAYDFETETRTFHPHITLARTREQAPASLAADLSKVLAGASVRKALESGSHGFEVTEVELVRSHLGKSGSRYETIQAFPLGGKR
jgi:RNA 2',3'-cyclic 3'-phosphodiesterase